MATENKEDIADQVWIDGVGIIMDDIPEEDNHFKPRHRRISTTVTQLTHSVDPYTIDVDHVINTPIKSHRPSLHNYPTGSNIIYNNHEEEANEPKPYGIDCLHDIENPSPTHYMDLSLGFRYLTDMYRYNLRPLIYISLSFIIMVVPALIIEDEWYSLFPFVGLLFINAIFVLWCFLKAICTCFPAQDVKDDKNGADDRISVNPNRRNSESSIKPYLHRRASNVSVMSMPETLQEFHRGSSQNILATAMDSAIGDQGKRDLFTEFISEWSDIIDSYFGIKKEKYVSRIEARISPPFTGLILILSTTSSIILSGLIQYKYNDSFYQLCTSFGENGFDEELQQNDIRTGQCLMRKIQYLNLGICCVMCFLIAAVLVSQVSSHALSRKLKKKKDVLRKYKHTEKGCMNITALNAQVESAVKFKIIDKMKISAMKLKMTFIFIFCFAMIFGFHLFDRAEYFFDCQRPKANIFDIYGRCCTLIEATILFYTLQRLMKQYEYPLIVMREFSKPIYCKNETDLLKWWQLRNYYRKYEIQTLSNVFHAIIGLLLLFTMICVAYLGMLFILWPGIAWSADEYIFMIGIFCLCYVVLKMCNIAVKTYKEQLFHATMLENEIIWVQHNCSDKLEIEKIERIKQRILQSDPIAILGINMTPTTILVLRAYFLAGAGAILLELMFPNRSN